jgi:hypothetical protein
VPIGDGPAPIIGVGVHRARWSRLNVPATLVACFVLLLVVVVSPRAGATVSRHVTTPSTPVVAALAPDIPLTLLGQTSWVAPGQQFILHLQAGRETPPVARLGVTVDVDACLSSVSGFDQSLSDFSSQSTVSSTTSPLPVTGLPVLPTGGFELAMPVVVGNSYPSSPPGRFTIDLTSAADQCGLYPSGVYPVRVQLVDTVTDRVLGGITTHLIYTEGAAGTQRLRFALVLPVRTALVAAPAPKAATLQTRPSAALEVPSTAALADVADTVGAVAHNPSVHLTIEANAQTVGALQTSGHQAAVNELRSLAADPSLHQLTSSTYTPVNASKLVSAGLGSELALQISRGTDLLSTEVTRRPTAPKALGVWVADAGLNGTALSQLQADGYSQLILPSDAVSSSPSNGSAAEPFLVDPGTGPAMTAIASSAALSARFTASTVDPVLAAHQLVAELAQIYYEQPNDDTARAMVAVAPARWSDNPAFVNALLGALTANPIIQSVTTTALFDTFPAAATCRDTCRLVPGSDSGRLPVAAIQVQRSRIDSFATAAPAARYLNAPLGDLVLAGESELLRPDQQSAVLHNTQLAVDAQLRQLTVASGQSITLTSQQGTLPIDIQSSAPYPVSATLTVTSDKLLFANGGTGLTKATTVLPGHGHTDVVYVKVRARTSGVFTVEVTLHAPVGGLLLSSGQIVVRSTATSIVGVILSLGAVVVLVVWWVRTSRKRRVLRRAEDEDGSRVPVKAG